MKPNINKIYFVQIFSQKVQLTCHFLKLSITIHIKHIYIYGITFAPKIKVNLIFFFPTTIGNNYIS